MTIKNKQSFANVLCNFDWNLHVCSINDVNNSYDKFISILSNAYENSFPLTRLSRKRCKDKKWVTLEIKKASEIKIQLYKKWLSYRSQSDREMYKSYIKVYNNLVNKIQREYFSTTFNSKINSSKKIWNEINKLCGLGARRASAGFKISKLVVNGQTITDSAQMANEFNNYFCSVGSELANNLPNNGSSSEFLDFMTPSVLNSFVCETISQSEVYNVIVKLATKSSSGPDEFSAKLIFDVASFITPTLCHIFNLSLSSGIFPSALKIAKVIPIFRKGSHSELGNYRPIALLKIFEKILEHIVSARILTLILLNIICSMIYNLA